MELTNRPTKTLLGAGLALALGFALAAGNQAAAQSWTELLPSGGPPLVRSQASAVYSPATNRMIVFAGLNGAGLVGVEPHLNDVWVLENADGLGATPNWIQLSPTGGPPIARVGHSAIYDPGTNRMTVFAGNPNFGSCSRTVNNAWVLENANGLGGTPNWIQLSPTGGPPSRRYSHSAVYDPGANRMIVFGGDDPCSLMDNQVWVLESANGLGGTPNWIQLSPTGGPPSSLHGRGVYNSTTNQLIAFGGILTATFAASNEVWVLDNANGLGGTPNWTQLSPIGGPPSERFAHTAVLNVGTNRMTVFGGSSNIAPISASTMSGSWALRCSPAPGAGSNRRSTSY